MNWLRSWVKLVLLATAQLWLLWLIMAALVLHGCGAPFVPAYEGEPDCGRPDALHAIRGVACGGPIEVACECDDRSSLECIDGVWTFSHPTCHAGFGVFTGSDGGP